MDFTKSQTDDELVSGVQSGSEKAFGLLYKQYEGKLMGYLYSKLRNQESAEEVFQISWSKVIDNIHKYKFTENFSSWLFTIASNSVKDWYRKSHNQVKLLESFKQENETSNQNSEASLDLNFLQSDAKKIIELQYVKGMSSKEISEKLSLTESNVRKISSRAKQKIKIHILDGGSLS